LDWLSTGRREENYESRYTTPLCSGNERMCNGMSLDPSKWYFRTYVFVVAFLCVGPLALPLVWINPRYRRSKKIFMTIITLLVSYAVFALMVKSTESIYNYYDQVLQLSR
jgi:hypothetical protein